MMPKSVCQNSKHYTNFMQHNFCSFIMTAVYICITQSWLKTSLVAFYIIHFTSRCHNQVPMSCRLSGERWPIFWNDVFLPNWHIQFVSSILGQFSSYWVHVFNKLVESPLGDACFAMIQTESLSIDCMIKPLHKQ